MQIRVNRVDRVVDDTPSRSLLVVLREELGLTSAKYGCGEGACGACTVLVDGLPVRSCVLPAAEVGSRPVTTLEGLAGDEVRGRLEAAFSARGASQCGYCTPGMLVCATALLHRDAEPTEERVVAAMDGNLCRCGCYRRITDAIGDAARGTGRGERARRAPRRARRSRRRTRTSNGLRCPRDRRGHGISRRQRSEIGSRSWAKDWSSSSSRTRSSAPSTRRGVAGRRRVAPGSTSDPMAASARSPARSTSASTTRPRWHGSSRRSSA